MSDDLVSVRMLIVSKSSETRELWRQAAGIAAVPIEVSDVDAIADASQLMARAQVDFVLIDAQFTEPHRSALAQAARLARTRPVVVLSAVNDEDAAGVTGDGVLTAPTTLAEAQYLIDRLLRARLPSRVLIVDDSSTMRSIVRKILSASRFPLHLSEAAEGMTALERLRNDTFDIVFLDYNMPGLNGLDMLARVRRDHPRLEVVMITSAQDEAMAARARAAGAAAFLKKPFFPADIDTVLFAYCGMRPIPV